MKRRILNVLRKSGLPALAMAAMLVVSAPGPVWAQHSGGHSGGRSGRSAGRSFSGGGQSFGHAQQYRGGGGGGFRGQDRGWGGGHYERHDHDRGGRGYYGGGWGGYYGAPFYGGFSFGPNYCTDGYYDNYGYWHPYPGCVAPWGY